MILSRSALIVLFFSQLLSPAAHALPEMPDAKNGVEPCPIRLALIGPRESQLGTASTYLFLVRNSGRCDLSGSLVRNSLPDHTKFRRADPIPFRITPGPRTILEWSNQSLPAGETLLIEVSMHFRGSSAHTAVDTLCVYHSLLSDGQVCKNFEIRITP